MTSREFTFQRGRGLVWVCDLEGSTKLLNDNGAVTAIEDFLPRFHWLARAVVDAFGGQFIKWNGDGFLAWFPF
jgi:class 3 adenylate cyclase